MKVTVHKDLRLTTFHNVLQVSVIVTTAVEELAMEQETIIHIITTQDTYTETTSILCDQDTTITVSEDSI